MIVKIRTGFFFFLSHQKGNEYLLSLCVPSTMITWLTNLVLFNFYNSPETERLSWCLMRNLWFMEAQKPAHTSGKASEPRFKPVPSESSADGIPSIPASVAEVLWPCSSCLCQDLEVMGCLWLEFSVPV